MGRCRDTDLDALDLVRPQTLVGSLDVPTEDLPDRLDGRLYECARRNQFEGQRSRQPCGSQSRECGPKGLRRPASKELVSVQQPKRCTHSRSRERGGVEAMDRRSRTHLGPSGTSVGERAGRGRRRGLQRKRQGTGDAVCVETVEFRRCDGGRRGADRRLGLTRRAAQQKARPDPTRYLVRRKGRGEQFPHAVSTGSRPCRGHARTGGVPQQQLVVQRQQSGEPHVQAKRIASGRGAAGRDPSSAPRSPGLAQCPAFWTVPDLAQRPREERC